MYFAFTFSQCICSGGIVFWADVVGSKHIYTSLKKWSEKYGNFYKPSRFLEERAMNGVPLVSLLFYPQSFLLNGT